VNEIDIKHMKRALEEARQCKPTDPDRIPAVGAVFAIGNAVLGASHRGSGTKDDDEHAEFNALAKISEKSQLHEATVYTTLEPCTKEVRSVQHKACTELILQLGVKRVFIGILDPNQGVCGKGFQELQKHGIAVEVFPHELAAEIRALMAPFIAAQQTIGAKIISPEIIEREIEMIEQSWGGGHVWVSLICECINPPGPNVWVIVEQWGMWFPQRSQFRQIDHSHRWETNVSIGSEGVQRIHVVRANPTGLILLSYCRDVLDRNEQRKKELLLRLNANGVDEKILGNLPSNWQGISMNALPKGLDIEDHIEVNIVKRK